MPISSFLLSLEKLELTFGALMDNQRISFFFLRQIENLSHEKHLSKRTKAAPLRTLNRISIPTSVPNTQFQMQVITNTM